LPRLKKIEMDGAEFTIAPLTLAQVDGFVQTKVDDVKPEELRKRSYQLVCDGLNNALPATENGNGTPTARWTPERISNELDMVLYQRLQSEILEFSGLKVTPKTGESPAAEDKSPISAAVS
jgi:hypothetical protein